MPVVTLDARCMSILDLLGNDWNVYTSPPKRLAARLRPKKQLPFRVSQLRLSQSSCFMSPYYGHNTMLSDYCKPVPYASDRLRTDPMRREGVMPEMLLNLKAPPILRKHRLPQSQDLERAAS